MKFQLLLTRGFINEDPTWITFTHNSKTSDGAGGWTVAADGISTQRVRLIPQSDKVPLASGMDGKRSSPEYVIVGEPTFDIRENDTFLWNNVVWRVSQRHPSPAYEAKWDVVKHER